MTIFLQIDNRQIDNRQIDNLSFSKIDTTIPFPCPHGLGNWHHGVVIFIMGEVRLSHSFTLASWGSIRLGLSEVRLGGLVALKICVFCSSPNFLLLSF